MEQPQQSQQGLKPDINPAAFIILAAAGGTLFMVLSGRAERVLAAVQGRPYNATGGSVPNPTVGTYTSGNPPSGYFPSGGLFGVAPKGTVNSRNQLGNDSTLPIFRTGHPAVADYDYLFNPGSSNPVSLPGGSSQHYKVLATINPGTAGTNGGIVFETPNGGLMAFLHTLSNNVKVGDIVPGGTVVGESGWPLSSQDGNGVAGPQNAHLAVIVDQTANQYLYGMDG